METWIPRNLRDDGMVPMNDSPSYASFVQQYVLLCDHQQAMADKDLAYQQLMEKAVRFAVLAGVRSACKDAYDFLQSPEVQAWRKEQP